jgi:tetratricopeptide (TPR) repeat protein
VAVAEAKPETSSGAEPSGSLSTALSHALRLLETKPVLAESQALEILHVVPDNPDALLILGIAKRLNGDLNASRTTLDKAAAALPFSADAHYQRGMSLAMLDLTADAKAAFTRATQLKPQMSDAWRALGDLSIAQGDTAAADSYYAQQIKASVNNPQLIEAASALVDNRLAIAERLLKDFLKRFPTDVPAIRMLAEVAARIGRFADAETLLRRCLELAPSFHPARHNYALALHRQGKVADALTQVDRLLALDPLDPGYRNLKAAVVGQIGDYPQTLELYAGVLRDYPNQPKVWMSYGHALKTAGRAEEGIAAYRRGIEQMPELGEAYWSLANLKTFRFTDDDLTAMRAQLARRDLSNSDRLHFAFALGKALEDAGDYAGSFMHYGEGNRIRKAQLGYDADETSDRVRRMKALFTPAFFSERAGSGDGSPDPIFIVGLPRSGSTLIEQILSSHSQIEGTTELPDIPTMALALGGRRNATDKSLYPENLSTLDGDRLKTMGADYLAGTKVQRKTDRPFYTDKTPHNFFHIGMIRLILPNAKIIDARRHPMGACFSGFKQHFARGHAFSYGQGDIGRYYRDYVALMAHFDDVAPSKIHRVLYESMVGDTEAEIRRLLDYCGLPFEVGCLRFHENDRAVRTASSEQVRQPIFRDGLDQWRNYEPWLGPLKAALGDVLTHYPEPPAFG